MISTTGSKLEFSETQNRVLTSTKNKKTKYRHTGAHTSLSNTATETIHDFMAKKGNLRWKKKYQITFGYNLKKHAGRKHYTQINTCWTNLGPDQNAPDINLGPKRGRNYVHQMEKEKKAREEENSLLINAVRRHPKSSFV